MKATRRASRRKKFDPRQGRAAATTALSARAVNDEPNGQINIPPSLSSFNNSEPGSSITRSVASSVVLEQLYDALGEVTTDTHPRTHKLMQAGDRKLARKVIEEACEVTVEAVKHDTGGVVRESADLLYHLVVLWSRIGIKPIEVWQEMLTRADTLGIAEKLPKTPGSNDAPIDSSR